MLDMVIIMDIKESLYVCRANLHLSIPLYLCTFYVYNWMHACIKLCYSILYIPSIYHMHQNIYNNKKESSTWHEKKHHLHFSETKKHQLTCFCLRGENRASSDCHFHIHDGCACTHGWCYVLNFSCCTCTQGGGGGMITFVALAHMVDATSLTLVVALAHRGGGGGGMIAFVALAHMVDATSLTLVVALAHMVDATSLTLVVALAHMVDATSLTLVVALAHRGVGGWDDNVRCSCTHGWCYVFNFSCCTLTLLALTLSNFLQSCRFFERLQGPEGWKKWRSASCNQKITWNVKVLNARSFKFKFL